MAAPLRAVIGIQDAVVTEAVRVGGSPGVADDQAALLSACPGQTKMEPLVEIGLGVLADTQADVAGRTDGIDLDIAGIELLRDVHVSSLTRRL